MDIRELITPENYKEVMKIAKEVQYKLHPEIKERIMASKRAYDKKKQSDPEYRKKLAERALNYYHSNPEYRQRQKEKNKERYWRTKELLKSAK